ncbi:MAG: EamA family transporter [Actinomycetota bacterium]|nr:EamA family transporter [Actinomycetota bacterium]
MLAKYGQSWILFAFVSAVGWGVWGFFSAKASKGTSPVALWATVVVIEGIVALPVFLKYRPVLSTFAILSALSGAVGYLFFFIALRDGSAPTVVAITATYPLITLVLNIVANGYRPHLREVAGVVMAVGAIYLLSSG